MNKTFISVLAGLGGMFGWGTSDFLASHSSGKIGYFKTFLYSQIVGVTLFATIALLRQVHFSFSPFLIFLMCAAGIAYTAAYLFFYKGFEIGNVSVVSTVSNCYSIFLVVIAYVVFGQRISGVQV